MIESTARGAWRDLEARLRPFVARRVRSPADVDDVVQDVFLRMQRGLAGLQEDERFGPWVYRVARSAIADYYRVAARHPLASAPADDERASSDDDAEDEDREAHEAVLGCIAPFVAALQTPYREAITLAELEGVTQREAADMLGVSVSAMKSRVQRGRMHLREALDSCCRIALDGRGRVQGCEPRQGQSPGAPCAAYGAAHREKSAGGTSDGTGADDGDTDAAWAEEINRRAQEVESGAAKLVDWDTARDQIAQRLRARR